MNTELLAIKTSGREIAVAVFRGTHLHFAEIRRLPTDLSRAETSAATFMNWLIATFAPQSAAVQIPRHQDVRAGKWVHVAIGILKQQAIPIQTLAFSELLSAFAVPPLSTQSQLRNVCRNIWPQLSTRKIAASALDAAAVGLYAQVERVLSN